MEKGITRSLLGMFMLLGLMAGSLGCMEESRQPEPVPEVRETVKVACFLQIDPLAGDVDTRAGEEINGEWTTAEEAAVNDLTVIQFDGDGTDESAVSIIVRTFKKPDLKNLTIGLMQPPDADKEQFLYFICNAGDALSGFSGTLKNLKDTQLTIAQEVSPSGGIVMTGTCRSKLVSGTPIRANLTRQLLKIRFTFTTTNLPQGDTFEPVWLQLLSVPQTMFVEPPGETTAEAVGFSDLYPVLDKIDQGYVWYIPENKRGTGKNISGPSSGKTAANAPDNYCTCILLEGKYHQASNNTDYKVYYRFYPGADNLNDFNLVSNQVYTVTLNLTGPDTSDGRVTAEEFTGSLPGANCYMTAPGSTLTFDPHAAPGTYVSATGWGSYENRMGTKDASKIDHVGLIWQTEKGLIKNIYNLVSSGEIRLSIDNKPGNALVAAYDADNNILWSWHIWVTDYSPAGVDDNMTANTAASVTNGHVYQFASCIWMDRGVGATTADPNQITTFGMSYQWGRKDPFVPPNALAVTQGASSALTPIYDAYGEPIYVTGKVFDSGYMDGKAYIFDNVMNNPVMFFTTGATGSGSTNYLWYGMTRVSDLWSSGTKTFFDPCPAGWCVPPATVISSFNTNNITIQYNTPVRVNNGLYGKGALANLYWPYVGYRQIDKGIAIAAGHQGVYWTSDYYGSNGQAKVYGAGWENNFDTYQRWHSDGQSVRCVKQKP